MRGVGIRRAGVALLAVSILLSACNDSDKVAPSLTAPAPLANGIVGDALTPVTFTASGSPSIAYSISAGSLPPGTSLDAMTGVYAGTPTAPGSYSFTITATNSKGSDSEPVTQTILQRPSISAPASPLASIVGGASTSTTFTAAGSSPITWSVSAGNLPPGITLDPATGVFSGTPTAAGNFSFTITATNSVGADSDAYTQQVTAPAANAHALVNGNGIAAFATSFASGLETPLALTGVDAGDVIVSIDRRPQNGFLYGLGFNATAGTVRLYAISGTTGVAAPVGATGMFVGPDGTTPVPVGAGANTAFGMDFNPTVDRVRVVNGAGQNFRINPNTGAFVDGNGTVANINMDGAINGAASSAQETAYTNSAPNATLTTQYTLDRDSDQVCIQNPPNAGTQSQCLALGGRLDAVLGFDIAPGVDTATANAPVTAGIATAVVRREGQGGESLARIDLTSGALTDLGAIGGGGISGVAIQQPAATPFIGLSFDGTQLVRFTSTAPNTTVAVAISGIAAGETLVGIDYRPQTGQLYGLAVDDDTDTATLYLLDPQTGAATPVGAVGQVRFVDALGATVPLPDAAGGYGFDFNPTVDRIRVTSSSGLNFRINPNNGAPVDGNLNNTAAPPDGINTDGNINGLPTGSFGVTGAAYTNSFGQPLTGGVTTQYVLDAESNQLFIQNPPNAGTVTAGMQLTVGDDPLEFTWVSGFDIPSDVRVTASGTPTAAGSAFAVLMVEGVQRLYSIDLTNARATRLATLTTPLAGLAVGQVALR
jgi:PKD repeat protein